MLASTFIVVTTDEGVVASVEEMTKALSEVLVSAVLEIRVLLATLFTSKYEYIHSRRHFLIACGKNRYHKDILRAITQKEH